MPQPSMLIGSRDDGGGSFITGGSMPAIGWIIIVPAALLKSCPPLPPGAGVEPPVPPLGRPLPRMPLASLPLHAALHVRHSAARRAAKASRVPSVVCAIARSHAASTAAL